jgi:tetratricopeptide (TPR) repeat protein
VILGWLRDGVAAGAIDPARPVHVVELGCGSGRFGYLLLNRLVDLLGRSSLGHLRLRYVLTDFTPSILDPLRAHPALAPLVAAGLLDFAVYDAGEAVDGELRLAVSGEVLAPGSLGNPLVAVANYVFDGLPHDCFFFEEDEVREGLVVLTSPEPEPVLDDPAILERVEIAWERRPLAGSPYPEPLLGRILEGYRERLRDTALLFPVGALRAILHLGELAQGRLLLLSADKGYCHEAMLHGREEPGIAIHGSFSLMVNYHVVGELFRELGGELLATAPYTVGLQVVAGLLDSPARPQERVETRLAFDEAIERRHPDDFFSVKIAVESGYHSLSLGQLLAWLRLSGWDSNVFLGAANLLVFHAESAEAAEREDLRAAAHRVWAGYFPIQESRDLAFHLGVLLCHLECHAEALPYFEQSLALHGRNPATVYNLALCHFALGSLDEAEAEVAEALAEAPELPEALALREEILEARKAAPPASPASP